MAAGRPCRAGPAEFVTRGLPCVRRWPRRASALPRRPGLDPAPEASGSSSAQSDSISHVAPAASYAPAIAPAAAGSSAGVLRSTTMSNGPVRPSRARVPMTQFAASASSSGSAGAPSDAVCTTIPSQRAARRIERAWATRRRPRSGSAAAGPASAGTSSGRTGSGRRRTRTARRTTGRRGSRASRRAARARVARRRLLADVPERPGRRARRGRPAARAGRPTAGRGSSPRGRASTAGVGLGREHHAPRAGPARCASPSPPARPTGRTSRSSPIAIASYVNTPSQPAASASDGEVGLDERFAAGDHDAVLHRPIFADHGGPRAGRPAGFGGPCGAAPWPGGSCDASRTRRRSLALHVLSGGPTHAVARRRHRHVARPGSRRRRLRSGGSTARRRQRSRAARS